MKDDRIASNYFVEVGRKPQPTAKQEDALFTELLVARQQVRSTEKLLKRETARCKRLSPGKKRNEVEAACTTLQGTLDNWARKVRHLENRIPEGYLRFVIKEARRRTRDEQLLKDLISAGNVGLMDAVLRFDVTVKVRFLTYAAYWINVRIQEFLSGDSIVHIPNHTRKANRKKRREEEAKCAKQGEAHIAFEEPIASGIDPETLTAEEPDVSNEKQILQHMEYAGLSRSEKLVLLYSFGFQDNPPRSNEEIAAQFYCIDGSVTFPELVRATKDRALTKLSTFFAEEQLQVQDL